MKRSQRKIDQRGGRYVPPPIPKERMSTGKKIGLGVFIGLGALIIIAAVFVLVLFFRAMKSSSARDLTSTYSEFISMYGENQANRDLPDGYSISNAVCKVDKSSGTYTISFNINNDSDTGKTLGYQCFYSEDYMALKGMNDEKPFISVPNDGSVTLSSKDSITVDISGAISKDTGDEKINSLFNYIYLEIASGNQTGRIMIPLTIS